MNTKTKQNIAKALNKASELIAQMAECIQSLDEYDDCADAIAQAKVAAEEFNKLAKIIEED